MANISLDIILGLVAAAVILLVLFKTLTMPSGYFKNKHTRTELKKRIMDADVPIKILPHKEPLGKKSAKKKGP